MRRDMTIIVATVELYRDEKILVRVRCSILCRVTIRLMDKEQGQKLEESDVVNT